ncbi:di-trans,poly-cis-decaprenylcistransferase [Candidatus Woesebacteria bacterium GWB1_43_5]|uniref:Isoprenyl transferase n=1 Tax=Candidatus Woesebacteria bacterium GWB1_43_5 TaxID=1802474 RepID=A0A1F7WT53_9BACT|nr:MAG: di-trans,poly-cis-decaprenylcistransferase [Candidatus Woesebacteria bacterium GWB1_43_5]
MSFSQAITLPKGTQIPNHIAFILDGNRRWARSKGLHPSDGHKAGYFAMKKVADIARYWGIHTITVWGFSTENWERSTVEVKNIMILVKKFLEDFRKEAKSEQIRFVHLGRKDRLPADIVKEISKLEGQTRQFKKHVMNLALDYGGKDEIVRATQKIVKAGISSDKIDENLFASFLDTGDQPYPYVDLFIRPSGEQRTSGLLPWQMSYAEFYWESDHLPEMTPEKLRDIILDYSRRRRRFGGDDKLTHLKFKPEMVAKFELAWWRLGNIPQGERFRDYTIRHLKEQYGLSKSLAREAAGYVVDALLHGKASKWGLAKSSLKKFYELVREELKLAFEPSIVASLEIKLLREIGTRKSPEESLDAEATAREFYAEVYRISLLQAAKLAHLRVLASIERNLALAGMGERHWDRAEDYLHKFYKELKDRVA